MNPIAVYMLNAITLAKAQEIVADGYIDGDAGKLYVYAFKDDEAGRQPQVFR